MFTVRSFIAFSVLMLATLRMPGAVDLKVAGRVVPGSCAVALSDKGEVNFGTIKASALNKQYSTPLQARQLTLSIDCAQLTNVALTLADGRAGSMIPGLLGPGTNDQQAFGLGMSGQTRIGNYYLLMPRDGLLVDGGRAELLYSDDGNRSWKRTGPAGELRRDYSYAWTGRTTRLPNQFRTLKSTLSVTPYITRADDLPLHQQIDLDGQASLELQYF
jgi:hypothetical protein